MIKVNEYFENRKRTLIYEEEKNGFIVEYEARKPKKDGTTTKGEFVHESMDEVIRRQAELKKKGYKVSRVMQCLF